MIPVRQAMAFSEGVDAVNRETLERITKTLASEVRRLREENERLRKDAERYRWLRDSDYDIGELFQHIQAHGLTNTGIDAAIDAARGAK